MATANRPAPQWTLVSPARGAVAQSNGVEAATDDPNKRSPIRYLALYFGCALLFLRISDFQALQTYVLHVNLGLLYIAGFPAIIGTLLCGGVPRAFRGRPAYYVVAFFLWICAAIPTSIWPGGSFQLASDYLRTNIAIMVVIGGVATDWRECKILLRALFAAAVGVLVAASQFQGEILGGRMSVEGTSLGNANDFGVHLLFCVPFLYWLVISAKLKVVRLLAFAVMTYAFVLTVRTGSRGALLGMAALMVAFFIWDTRRHRIAALLGIPILAAVAMAAAPQGVLDRLGAFITEKDVPEEAQASADTRRYLFDKSIEYTLKFPIFGVGPSQFAFYEGTHNQYIGDHGSWHGTHNTYTQISAECGIVALILVLAGMGATFRSFHKIYREASARSDCDDIRNAALCLMLSMIASAVSFTFVNFGYNMYYPIFAGFAVILPVTAREEMARRGALAGKSTATVIPTRWSLASLRTRPIAT
jgi:O-antigen ligase